MFEINHRVTFFDFVELYNNVYLNDREKYTFHKVLVGSILRLVAFFILMGIYLFLERKGFVPNDTLLDTGLDFIYLFKSWNYFDYNKVLNFIFALLFVSALPALIDYVKSLIVALIEYVKQGYKPYEKTIRLTEIYLIEKMKGSIRRIPLENIDGVLESRNMFILSCKDVGYTFIPKAPLGNHQGIQFYFEKFLLFRKNAIQKSRKNTL